MTQSVQRSGDGDAMRKLQTSVQDPVSIRVVWLRVTVHS